MRRHPSLRLILVLLALALTAASFAQAAPALQDADANGPATIISFTSSLPFVAMPDLESGDLPTVLSWHVIGLNDDQRLVLDRFVVNSFVSMLNEGETTLPPNGEREIVVTPTGSFAPPTYRLSILDFRNRIVDQQTVTIQYIVPTVGDTEITTFVADSDGVERAALEGGSARVNVSWNIASRPPTSNPVFEQVMSDGSFVNIELPRDVLWVPSAGSGAVAPVLPSADAPEITLRLRVLDLVDGTVYAEATQTLTIGTPGADDGGATQPEATPEGTSEAVSADGQADIVSFTVTPDTVAIGGSISLAWDVSGAASVQIAVRTSASTEQIVIAGNLPLRAGLTIPVGAETFTGINNLTFILRAMDANGNALRSQRADVTITG